MFSDKIPCDLVACVFLHMQGTIPNPFPIPYFRKYTQANLDKELFTDEDRKYIVSVLGTMLLTYKDSISKHDCRVVAEALVRKYPFLKEPVSILSSLEGRRGGGGGGGAKERSITVNFALCTVELYIKQ